MGRATALPFAREGAKVPISYPSDPQNAEGTIRRMRDLGGDGLGVGMDAAAQLAEKGIRVNSVAPGPVRTLFIKETRDEEKIRTFGQDTLLGRPAEAFELAPG